MERVLTLVEKLQEQIKGGEAIKNLLLTTKMLQTELVHLQSNEPESSETETIAVNLPPIYDRVTMEVDHKSETLIAKDVKMPSGKEEPKKEEIKFAEISASEMEDLKKEDIPEEDIPYIPQETDPASRVLVTEEEKEEKVVSVLEVNEEEIEAELEEIKKNAKDIERLSVHSSPQLLFDPVEDTPTLRHQNENAAEPIREINEVLRQPASQNVSHNDKLKEEKTEVSHALSDAPIKDLRKAIGVNDRFLFINELFRGDENMYERSIKTINGYNIYAEAVFWIKRELKLKLGWNEKDDTVKQFDNLIKRRFL